jgi:hypothetical protein
MSGIRRFAALTALLLAGAQAAAFAQANLAADADLSGARGALGRLLALNAASEMTSPEGRALLTGELARWSRPTFGPLISPDKVLALTGGRAVARIPAQGEDLPDLYLYLRQQPDRHWTIEAARTLSLMQLPREVRRRLRALLHRTAEMEATLRNWELVLASDARLRSWFGENRTALTRLRRIAENGGPASDDYGRRVETSEA